MTSLAFLNCRGANKREAYLYLKDFVKNWDVFFVGIVETKISSLDKVEINQFLGDECDFFLHPSDGASGGIMILWKAKLAKFTLARSSSQCVVGSLDIFNKGIWLIATVYGNKSFHERRRLWDQLEEYGGMDIPMVVGGDFNCILTQSEKRGGKKFSFFHGPQEMSNFMTKMDLHDVGLVGPKFTWCNNKTGNTRILERLDRCLLNIRALEVIHNTTVRHLERIASDHCPIVLKNFNVLPKHNRLVRYEEVWASYLASQAIVKKTCSKTARGDAMEVINVKCKRVLKALYHWSKEKLKNFMELKETLKKKIAILQLEESSDMVLSIEKLMMLRSKVYVFNVTLTRINTWWRQRVKVKWIQKMDMNSNFFHSIANGRRSGNTIRQLKNDDGVLVEDQVEIKRIFLEFFKNKWRRQNCQLEGWPPSSKILSEAEVLMLQTNFTKSELDMEV
ncbi:uncharacterized protein LOC114579795 [Dendrobium catenatum]|uniref:uncharacterized protein LOC114579795 n=1 Tax=Dendrobium catenatum TaxID=906689 RepID=UPI00109F78A6|nr:uncharacterized protein LOC114579795 [Dendrobium catenatum]